MLRLHPESPTSPAPLVRSEREQGLRALLAAVELFPRRVGFANSAGLTITYLHFAEAATAMEAVGVIAKGLDWQDTEVAFVAGGAVAVTTERG